MKMWKTAFAATAIMVAAISVAEARPSTLNYTCSQAKALVRDHGTILMSTGGHTYDRFVYNRSFCPNGDYIKRATAPTRDRRSCSIGYVCTMDNPYDN